MVSPDPSPQRRVSIADGTSAHDNPAFEANSETPENIPPPLKSILHHNNYISGTYDIKQINGEHKTKKHSVSDSIRFSENGEADDRSWWYTFCLKCHNHIPHPSWEPRFWPTFCPHPYCPSYRQVSRIVALALIGVFSWIVLYAFIGKSVAPGGHLFQLILLTLSAYLGGCLVGLTTLPKLTGMLIVGCALQNIGIVDIDDSFFEICRDLRHIALVIILVRAGLDLDPSALKRLKFTVIKLGIGPWLLEAGTIVVLSHFLLGLPWSWAALLGSIIAAVAPAVVVACLFRLRTKGYGVAKGIPTLIIAVAGADDALSLATFGIMKSLMFSNDSLTLQIMQGPISIFGGLGFGFLWGLICKYIPELYDPFMIPLRILLLLAGGLVAIFGSELIGYDGAGPLACISAGFTCLYFWSQQGWDIEENPASTAFEIMWMIFEPVLFGVTGTNIKMKELSHVTTAVAILLASILIRMIGTILLGIGCKLNLKEKIFVALAWVPKAAVQAALGPIAWGIVKNTNNKEHEDYAKKVIVVSVLSIILTAPMGAIIISLLGSKLLKKTKFPEMPIGRRSHRPSIRDISIIDEEEEIKEKDVESISSSSNPNANETKNET